MAEAENSQVGELHEGSREQRQLVFAKIQITKQKKGHNV